MEDIMSIDLVIIAEYYSISEATNLMLLNKIDSLPVIRDNDQFIGTITTTELPR
jgi:CBS domain-containing protein